MKLLNMKSLFCLMSLIFATSLFAGAPNMTVVGHNWTGVQNHGIYTYQMVVDVTSTGGESVTYFYVHDNYWDTPCTILSATNITGGKRYVVQVYWDMFAVEGGQPLTFYATTSQLLTYYRIYYFE